MSTQENFEFDPGCLLGYQSISVGDEIIQEYQSRSFASRMIRKILPGVNPDLINLPVWKEDNLVKYSTQNATTLIHNLFNQPVEQTIQTANQDPGIFISLPFPSTPLPRAHRIPEPKPLTKWEKFAQMKGITKKKRSRKVWDENAKEWRDRYGRNKAGTHELDDWAVPVPSDYEGGDPRAALKEKRSKERKKQLFNEVRNRRERGDSTETVSARIRRDQSKDMYIVAPKRKRSAKPVPMASESNNSTSKGSLNSKVNLGNIASQIQLASTSTASIGRHNKIANTKNSRIKIQKPHKALSSRIEVNFEKDRDRNLKYANLALNSK